MKKLNIFVVINIVVVLFLFALPYYLFDGKIFVGGDDTRLFYTYPQEFIREVSFFSWHNLSTLGIFAQDQVLLPLLSVWTVLDNIIQSKIVTTYLAFSLPLILGFIFFQKSAKELFSLSNKNNIELFIGSLFFIFSPILIHNQYFIFLTTIWLIGLIPMILYLYIKYLKTSNFKYVLLASVACFILSVALWSIPWILGLLLPLTIGLFIISFFYGTKEKIFFIKKTLIFSIFIVFTQAFWLFSFALAYIVVDANSYAQKFVSDAFVDTFSPTVNATATGNIFYPLLNLFHRQITVDFVWKLNDVYVGFYDKTYYFNIIYVFILFFGLINFKKVLNKSRRNIYLLLIISFIFSLYFFTVNIGPFKELFLEFGNIPGFLMFRNFYDKFAPGFVLIYSLLITISLVIIRDRIRKYKLIFVVFFFVTLLNFVPIKDIVNSPLWTTESIHRVIKIPDEYINFMDEVNTNISPTNTILNIPFGTSIYSVIKDEDSNNVFVGSSPVRLFSGVNDISGYLSFNFTDEALIVNDYFVNSDIEELNKILYKYNINYVMVTKNIPDEVRNAWVFESKMLEPQNEDFIKSLTSKKIIISEDGNYELYKTNTLNSLIKSKNISFKKISPVKYRIYINSLKDKQDLSFLDSYHGGWKLYLQKNPNKNWCIESSEILDRIRECKSSKVLFQFEDLTYLNNSISEKSHIIENDFSNKWTISSGQVKNNYESNFYQENEDGSIDIELVMYFFPQNYFYYGLGISFITFILGVIYYVKKKKY